MKTQAQNVEPGDIYYTNYGWIEVGTVDVGDTHTIIKGEYLPIPITRRVTGFQGKQWTPPQVKSKIKYKNATWLKLKNK